MHTSGVFSIGVVGICTGIFFRSFFTLGVFWSVFFLLLALVCASLWRRNETAFSAPFFFATSVFLLCLSVGIMRMDIAVSKEYTTPIHMNVGEEIMLEGVVVTEPSKREKSTHVTLQIDGTRVLLFIDRSVEISYGDRVTITGTLLLPEAFETDLGRVFDYKGYLKARGIEYTLSYPEVEILAHDQANPFIGHLYASKGMFMQKITEHLKPPQSGLGVGLLLGVKQALGEELELSFRKAGIMHIVVLSGYNIMLVVVFVMYILSWFLPLKARLVCGLVAISAFAILVGLSATVLRASAMAGLILVAQYTGRTYAVIRALLITGVGMLLLNPYLLVFDVGFQLSFIATLGLILLSPHIETRITHMPTLFNLRSFLTATLATQLFITPILLYQIGEFSVVSVMVNLLVLPMVPVAMLLTFAVGVSAFIAPVIATWIGFGAYLSLSYIIWVAHFFASVPFATFVVPAFPFWMVLATYSAFAYVIFYLLHNDNQAGVDLLTHWTIVEEDTYIKELAEEHCSSANSVSSTRV